MTSDTSEKGLEALIVRAMTGRIDLVHLNDSRDEADSGADRHASLGAGHIDPDLSGRPCWAGARYFIVDHTGEAFRCYPARRYRQEHLGNLLTPGFRLRTDAEPCHYSYCNCTVPQQRGMVDTR